MKYDIAIIGSGPAGLGAALYAKRANLSVLVIEKEYEGTGQIAESGCVDNYLGMQEIGGYELGEAFRNHVVSLGVDFIEHEVQKIRAMEDGDYEIIFENNDQLKSKTIIYAAGASARKANILGEAQYIGKGVSYCAICDGSFYKDKVVAVLGGGDTALDDARYLSDLAKKVYLIHRRNEFRGAAKTVEALKQKDNVEILLNRTVEKIYGENKVTGVLLSDGQTLSIDGVFIAFGSVPNTKLIEPYVKLDTNGYVLADESGITEQKGLFIAGDLRRKQLRQVITAVADGANAATSAYEYLKTK